MPASHRAECRKAAGNAGGRRSLGVVPPSVWPARATVRLRPRASGKTAARVAGGLPPDAHEMLTNALARAVMDGILDLPQHRDMPANPELLATCRDRPSWREENQLF